MRLLPDPDKVKIRVYGTQSTHKSMSALRQGSMILVRDEDFGAVHGAFEEAYFTHTSTSPNLQIIASLDVARRQMELEGYELVIRATDLALRIRRQVNSHPLISKYFRVLTPAEMVPAEYRESGIADYGWPHNTRAQMVDCLERATRSRWTRRGSRSSAVRPATTARPSRACSPSVTTSRSTRPRATASCSRPTSTTPAAMSRTSSRC